MEKHPFAASFRDLIVYQKAKATAKRVFDLSKSFPKEELYSLTDQVRRSSRSIGGQIAEAWAKRRYPNHFVAKLTDADGEQNESQHWVDTAEDCQYIDAVVAAELRHEFSQIGRMLQRMIDRAEEFRGDEYTGVREAECPYVTNADFSVTSAEHRTLNTEH